ncbi:MAG: dicarboxylate/amino acid:cation symporter [Polyangiaceae bacterium]|nr:dicarboxylate/amino acid:cation symporter [Polyangiaceae bacterium]
MRKLALHWQILISLVLAAILGAVASPDSQFLGISVLHVLDFFGELFLRALKMLVLPLIVASIISGIAAVGDEPGVGRLGAKTGIYYLLSSFVAIVIGLAAVVLIQPGLVDGEPARELIGLTGNLDEVAEKVEGRGAGDLVDIFLRMIPVNVVQDAAAGQLLSVIVFSLLFGYFMTRIPAKPRAVLEGFWQGVYEVMLKMTDFVLLFAPLGVFGLVGRVAISTGAEALIPLASFFLTVVLALSVHALVAIPLTLQLLARVNPLRFFRAMAPAFLMAFSTASSAGTLPVTMEKVQEAGVSRRVASFTLPLGATVNMDGTALYECVAAVFIGQAYGLDLGFTQLFVIVLIALMTSIGVAGIPAASLVAITLILTTMGLPIEGVGLILAVDRILDMCRTAVNVLSDSCAAVVVARWEGEASVLSGSQPNTLSTPKHD